jgi:hypothetical protein
MADTCSTSRPVLAVSLESLEAGDRFRVGVRLGREARHHGKRCAGVGAGFRHAAGTPDLVDAPVEHDHIAIKIGEDAKADIAILQDRAGADFPVLNARDEGT